MGTREILNALAMIFVMIVPGVFMKKKGVIDERQTKGLSSVVMTVTWPCLVIDAMQMPYSKETFADCMYVLLLSVAILSAAFVFSLLVVKAMRMERSLSGLLTFMVVFGNTGFMGIPVIYSLYGKDAVFFAAIVELACDILMFSVGVALVQYSAGRKAKRRLREFVNPGLIGVLTGFLLFVTDTALPGFIGESVSVIGAATTPLVMFVIGSQLAEIRWKEALGDRHLPAVLLGKLVVIPAIAVLLLRVLLKDDSLLACVVILSFAMPVAAGTTIFAQQYGADVDFSTKGVLVSTLLCLVTIPVFAMLL